MKDWIIALAVSLALLPGSLHAEEEKGGTGNSLGDLFNKVKDIKVPDSVSSLPTQLTELKESYLETAKTVDELRTEVEALKNAVYDLRKENEELRAAVGVKVKENEITGLLKAEEITATNLAGAYKIDRIAADEEYKNRYLKVVGTIAGFESGSQAIVLNLKSESNDSLIRCEIQTGNDFYVDVLPTQGRLISRNDRRTLLTVGQPVAVLGTCTGATLNVNLVNAKIDGLTEMKAPEAPAKK
ncbi:MAG: hypothetical protein P1U86_04280 [Verrucomicrobiales bacterium]|nr:hypothetical protein [Verrucomicrobiales bacterium]